MRLKASKRQRVVFNNFVTACNLLLFYVAVVHIVGHCFNIYHISSQTANDLACLFRNYFHAYVLIVESYHPIQGGQ